MRVKYRTSNILQEQIIILAIRLIDTKVANQEVFLLKLE